MNFNNINKISIPEGNVLSISIGGRVVWCVGPLFTAVLYDDGSMVFYGVGMTPDSTKTIVATYTEEHFSNPNSVPWYDNRLDIKNVSFIGNVKPISTAYWFYDCENLTLIDLSNLNTSNVTDMKHMFDGCDNLATLDLSNFDTSKVTDMSYMFYNCYNLTTIYASDLWSTESVINSDEMFYDCMNLSGMLPYNSSYIDSTYATTINGYLTYKEHTIIIDLQAVLYDDGSMVFYGVGMTPDSTKTIVSSYTGWINQHFYNYNSVPWYDNRLDIKNVSFIGNVKPISTAYWFYDCENLTLIDLSNLNTSNVTDMRCMFRQCYNLTTLDLSNFDTSKVTDMHYMFGYCESLTSLDLSHFNTNNVATMSNMFISCKSLTSLDLSHFNTSQVDDMGYMFCDCESLTSLDVSSFDTSDVYVMYGMFKLCESLTSLDLSHFNTSGVSYIDQMFSDCRSLTYLDISNFNTSKVADMKTMFEFCSSLTSLDVSSFDTSKVTNMERMFAYCSNLTTIYASDLWSTQSVTSSDKMFSGSSKLSGDIVFNAKYIDATYATTTGGYLTYKNNTN